MALTTPLAFSEFEEKINPTENEKNSINNKRLTAHKYLSGVFDSNRDMPLIRTSLIGSAERNTQVRPLDDVDVMAVFSDVNNVYENTYRTDSHTFINRVRDALNEYSTELIVGTRGQAVRLFYKQGVHVDIAPVFISGESGYLLPDGSGGWKTTDPDEHTRWLNEKNVSLGYHLKPVIRLLKKWNKVHSKHYHSYHLEVAVAEAFVSLDWDYRDALAKFFGWAKDHIDSNDPAGHSGNLASYLSNDMRSALRSRLENAESRADDAVEAEKNGDHEKSIRLWRIELGADFPSFG